MSKPNDNRVKQIETGNRRPPAPRWSPATRPATSPAWPRKSAFPTRRCYSSRSARSTLPVDKMQALTTIVFHGMAQFDPTLDRLRPVNTAEPVSQGSRPPPYAPPPNQPKYEVGTLTRIGPQPVKPGKPVRQGRSRRLRFE